VAVCPFEYGDMTGLGMLPAGLFSFPEEKYIRCDAELRPEMHPLWTITTKGPNYKAIVQSIRKMSKMYP